MNIIFALQAFDDYPHWQANDRRIIKRINSLTAASCETIRMWVSANQNLSNGWMPGRDPSLKNAASSIASSGQSPDPPSVLPLRRTLRIVAPLGPVDSAPFFENYMIIDLCIYAIYR